MGETGEKDADPDSDGAIVIEIVTYNPAWPRLYAQELERLRSALGHIAARIEHNGSTSIPGLAAKPVIDIQVSVLALAPIEPYRLPLEQLGYTHVPHADDAFCPFFHRPSGWPHTHHLHVVVAGGDEESRTLAFRDYLRDHRDALDEYASLKRILAMRFSDEDPASQERYACAKSAFIEDIIARARAEGYRHTAPS